MLEEAKHFVTEAVPSEFLILKFDKCLNWNIIRCACQSVLSGVLLTGVRNLNNATLKKLRGKVIVLFSSAGLAEVVRDGGHNIFGDRDTGIFGFKNLHSRTDDGGAYDELYKGLQYYGKGGSSV